MIDQAEADFRAANNDLCLGRMDAFVDACRVSHPDVRYATYCLHRLASPAISQAWDLFAGGAKEGAYIHHAGVRRVLPTGQFVMNMGHAPYLAWRRDRTIDAMEGTEFGGPPHPTGPMNIVDYDLVLPYPEYDATIPAVPLANDPQPRVGDSDEYPGDAQGYMDDCADDLIATQAAVQGALGTDFEVMPNFGSMVDAMRVDSNTVDVINAVNIFCCETSLRYGGGKLEVPDATEALARWSFIDVKCAAGKQIIAQGYVEDPDSQAKKDQLALGVAAFFLLADNPGLYGRAVLDITEPAPHIQNWEANTLMRTATAFLGDATAATTEVFQAPGITQVRLFKREFTYGVVYMCFQKAGQTGNQPAVDTLVDPMFPLGPTGVNGALTDQVSLQCGDAAIFYNGALTSDLVLTGTITGEWNSFPVTPDADHWTLINQYPPGDASSYIQSTGHLLGLIEEHALSSGPPIISKITSVRVKGLFKGTLISNIPAIRIEIWVGGVKVGERNMSFEGDWQDVSINIPVAVLGPQWYAGPRSIKLIPIDGNVGYPGFPMEL